MKKICFLLRSHFMLSNGGAELQSYYLADSFLKKGWEVHYILEEKNSFPKMSVINGINFHWLKQRSSGMGLLNYWQLSKIFRQVAPDVIYQRGALDYTGVLGILAKQHKMKYVWAAASNKDCQKRKYAGSILVHSNPFKKLLTYPKLMACDCLVSYGIKCANIAIVQSKDQQKMLAKNFSKPSNIVKSGHPIPYSRGRKPMIPSILWTANIKSWKRVDIFVDLAKACQDIPARFLVIGRDRRKILEDPHIAIPAMRNFTYLGPLDIGQVEAYMQDAYIFVNTSNKDCEGFPNTFIQAWMRKTPVITLNTDPDGIIKRHQLGFHSGNFKQMVRDVRLLLTDNQLRRKMGENAYSYATQEHNIENTVESLERAITSLI